MMRNIPFGQLLRDCRLEAKLKQKDLGLKIHIDGSMISRFETGRTLPNPSTLQEIINALALQEVPREKLDRLWEAAGYYRTEIFEAPVADPIVAFIQQEFEKLNREERTLLSQDLRSVIETDQAYFSAKEASEQRKWSSSGEDLLSLRDLLEHRNQRWYLRIDEELGWCRYSEARYAEAVQYYESALWSARQLGDLRKQGEILIRLGDTHRRLGGSNWEIAHERYTEAMKILEDQKDRIRVADCLRKIAATYLFQGRPDKALPLCEDSLNLSHEEGDDRGVYKALQHKLWAYDMLGKWSEATQLGEEALAIVKRVTSDEWELAKALRYLADAYRIQRRIKEAEKTYMDALDILLPYKDRGIAALLHAGMIQLGLAKVYIKQPGRELEAKAFLNEGLQTPQGLREDFMVAGFLLEQGSLLLKLGRLDEAEMRLQQASDRFRRLGNIFHYANTLASLCELYRVRGDEEDSARMSHAAETVRNMDKDLIGYHLARIELIVGKAYVDGNRLLKASDAFCVASERALAFNDESFLEICEEVMGEIDWIAQNATPEAALQLCDSFITFWSNKDLSPEKQHLVTESLEAIRRKQEEIKLILP